MHLAALYALFKDQGFLNNLYLGSNAAEFFLTAILFYLAAQIKKEDRLSDERAFRLNHFLLTNNLIEELAGFGRSPSPAILEAAYHSLEFVRHGRSGELERHFGSYDEYRRAVAEHIGHVTSEAGIRRVLTEGDARRSVFEYAEITAFILLIVFQVFSTWFVLQPAS